MSHTTFTTLAGSLLLATAVAVPFAADSADVRNDDVRVVAQQIMAAPESAATSEAGNPATACTDLAYALQSWKLTTTFKWLYNPANAPASVASTTLPALRTGTSTVFTGQNRCGIAPRLSMTEAYQGLSTKTAQVSVSGTCTGNDSVSVTSWGNLPASTLAYTCTYYRSNGSVLASDMLISRTQPFYTTKPAACSNMFDLVAVIVHERGHTAGLAHVDQATHGVATMSPRTLPCDSTERLLSAGDLAGLKVLYGV